MDAFKKVRHIGPSRTLPKLSCLPSKLSPKQLFGPDLPSYIILKLFDAVYEDFHLGDRPFSWTDVHADCLLLSLIPYRLSARLWPPTPPLICTTTFRPQGGSKRPSMSSFRRCLQARTMACTGCMLSQLWLIQHDANIRRWSVLDVDLVQLYPLNQIALVS